VSYQQHKEQSGTRVVSCAVITCSDTRTQENDLSGHKIIEYLGEAGHEIVHYEIVKDEPDAIRHIMRDLVKRLDVQAVILNGGTGIAKRDNTFDTVVPLLTKTLPGFGELFRMLSYEAVGAGAMLSRATAGVVLVTDLYGAVNATVVFSIPGSPNAVEVAMKNLIVPELSHLVWETLR